MAVGAVAGIRAPAATTIARGGTAQARIAVRVADGYHVQANPASDPFLIPVRLDLKAGHGVRPGKPVYPPGERHRLEGAPDELMTYTGTFEIVVPLQAAASAPTGDQVLRGVLRYQGCNARTCLFPVTLPVTLPVRVVDPLS